MLKGPKNLLLCMFFHEQRYKRTSLEKEEATLVRLVALNIHHNEIQVLSIVNSLPCIQPHSVLHVIMLVVQLLQYVHLKVFLHLLGLTIHIFPLQYCWHQVEFCNYQLCSYLHHFGQTACQLQHTWKNFLTVQHLDCLCDLQIHELCWINFQHNLGWFGLLK